MIVKETIIVLLFVIAGILLATFSVIDIKLALGLIIYFLSVITALLFIAIEKQK